MTLLTQCIGRGFQLWFVLIAISSLVFILKDCAVQLSAGTFPRCGTFPCTRSEFLADGFPDREADGVIISENNWIYFHTSRFWLMSSKRENKKIWSAELRTAGCCCCCRCCGRGRVILKASRAVIVKSEDCNYFAWLAIRLPGCNIVVMNDVNYSKSSLMIVAAITGH